MKILNGLGFQLSEVRDIIFEYAPTENYTTDNSAFDVEDERFMKNPFNNKKPLGKKVKKEEILSRILDKNLEKVESMEKIRFDLTRIDPKLKSRIDSMKKNISPRIKTKSIFSGTSDKQGIIKEGDKTISVDVIDEDEE